MLNSLNSITQTLLEPAGMTKNPPEQLSPQNQGGKESTGQTGQVSPGTRSPGQKQQGMSTQNKRSDVQSEADLQGKGDKNENGKESGTAESEAGKQQGSKTGTVSEASEESQQPWQMVDQMIQGLHQQWNALEPNIIKVGAKPELLPVLRRSSKTDQRGSWAPGTAYLN